MLSRERQAVEMRRSVEEMVAEQFRSSELARQHRAEEGHAVTNPVITISRTMGSGGLIVARKLAEKLNFSLWDRELIDLIAAEAEIPPSVVEAFDEKAVSEIELVIRAALGDYASAGFMYGKHLARTVAMIASVGNAIILGRGANYLLKNALNIRMDASLEKRIANMMEYEDIGRNEAEVKLHQSDKERRQFILKVFGKEKINYSQFDLSIWMDEFSAPDAVSIIETAFHARFKAG